MTQESLKESVVKNYGKLARISAKGLAQTLFPCCKTAEVKTLIGKKIGYSEDEINEAPDGANLGVGCGNPASFGAINKGETVVDLGSGAGFDAFILSPLVGEKGAVLGIDLADEMLDLARKNASKGNFSNVRFIKGDIEQIPLENEIADHVISNCVINLSQHKAKVFREAYRILKPGGRLAVSDVLLETELPAIIKNSLGGHLACISGAEKIDQYLNYIKDAGFSRIEIVKKGEFPLELMLADPQLKQLAKELGINPTGRKAAKLAKKVKSVGIVAVKE
ncbi:MAG: arsenite methyltransferase [Bacteroidia bacterium]|nr:arsenite methyltransferase [Bacteroidia bacterium]